MKTHILAANMFTLVASSDGALLRKVDGGRKNAGTSQMKTSTKSNNINQVPDRSLVWGDDIPRPQPHYGHPPQSQPQYGYPVQPQPHWNDLSQLQPHYGDAQLHDGEKEHYHYNPVLNYDYENQLDPHDTFYQSEHQHPQHYFDTTQPYNVSNIYSIFNGPHSSGHPTSPHLYTLPQVGEGATARLTVLHHPQPEAISETNEYEHSGKQQEQLLLGRPCTDFAHRPTDESCGESSRRHFNGSGQNTPSRPPAAYGKDSPSRPKKSDGPRPHSLPQNPDDPHSRPSDRTNNPPPQRPPPVETTKKPYLPGLNQPHFQALFPNGPIEPFPPSDDSDDSDDSDG